MKVFQVGLILVSAVLTACVHHPPIDPVPNWDQYQRRLGAIDEWKIKGKLGVKIPDESVPGANIDWLQESDDYSIHLWGAFGNGTTWIYGNSMGVRIERPGEDVVAAKTPELLLRDTLGYEIPVDHMRYWVRGIPEPQTPITASEQTPEGVLESLEQSGWMLAFSRYRAVGSWALPHKVVADNGEIRLTLVVKEWAIDTY